MNNLLPDDDGLDAQLQAHFSTTPVADDGFSQRVLAALPASDRKSFLFSRQFFCLAGLTAGMMCAAIGLIRSENLESALQALDSTVTAACGQLMNPSVGLAIGLALLSLAFAFRGQLRLRA